MKLAAWTDFLRLAAGELVYMGLLRTRLDAILPAARLGARTVPLAPELFAIMADTRLAWGQISAQRYSCDTADGAGKDRQSALRRLARCVCADLEEIGKRSALAIAEQACRRQKEILVAAISRQAKEHALEKVVAAGKGEITSQRRQHSWGWSACVFQRDMGPGYRMSSRPMPWPG